MGTGGPGAFGELLERVTSATSVTAFDTTLIEWLAREVGCDLYYRGPARLDRSVLPVTTGVDPAYVRRCEQSSARYRADRACLHRAALAAGGAVVDVAAFAPRELERMPLYTEVMRGLGVRAVLVGVTTLGGRVSECFYLGRTSSTGRIDRGLDTLRAVLPVLALAGAVWPVDAPVPDAARAEGPCAEGTCAPPSPRARPLDRRVLTAREQEVVHFLSRGFTNVEIAHALGTSAATVKHQVSAILAKADVSNRTELAAMARSSPWLWPSPATEAPRRRPAGALAATK